MDPVKEVVSLSYDYFLIFAIVSSPKLREAQSEDWQMICMCALSKLVDVCHRIIYGDILVHELKTISNKEPQMRKLCAAAAPSKQKQDGKKSSQVEDVPSYDIVKMHLDLRLKELDYFVKYRGQLQNFLHVCGTVALSG